MPLPFPFKEETMTNILTSISTYDLTSHTPYPKLEYILEQTGEDLITASDEAKAKAQVYSFTKTAKNFLFSSKLPETRRQLEYLIATDEDYRLAFLDYVVSFIQDVFLVGVDNFFKPTSKLDVTEVLSPKTKSFITGSILSASVFKYFHFEYHVGY
jgi:hypothetical protein